MNTRTNRRWLPAMGALLALAACASTPPPPEMALADAALARAVAAGAPELAAVEMAAARDKMSRANRALAADEPEGARALAQQAQLDAQLAQARAESERARRAELAVQDAAGALRDEMARPSR